MKNTLKAVMLILATSAAMAGPASAQDRSDDPPTCAIFEAFHIHTHACHD